MDSEKELRLTAELRERLGALLAAAQLLAPLVREKGEAQDKEHLMILNQTLYRLIRTVRHMDLTRDEPLPYRPQVIDAAGLCRDLGREVEALLESAGVDFSWSAEPETLLTQADDALLEQALLDLLTNAAEHAGTPGRVALRFSARDGRAVFTVEDNGSGLQPAEPDPDPFLKTPGGVGLGLDTAQRIAEAHGGSLMLDSRPDHGLRAILSFPLRKGDGGTVQTPMPRAHLGGFSPVLVELSPVLPPTAFAPEDLD